MLPLPCTWCARCTITTDDNGHHHHHKHDNQHRHDYLKLNGDDAVQFDNDKHDNLKFELNEHNTKHGHDIHYSQHH